MFSNSQNVDANGSTLNSIRGHQINFNVNGNVNEENRALIQTLQALLSSHSNDVSCADAATRNSSQSETVNVTSDVDSGSEVERSLRPEYWSNFSVDDGSNIFFDVLEYARYEDVVGEISDCIENGKCYWSRSQIAKCGFQSSSQGRIAWHIRTDHLKDIFDHWLDPDNASKWRP